MKAGIIFGIRPEIIKIAPVIKEYEKRKLEFFIIHTGQHYSYELDKVFFEELNLPQPKYNLECGYETFRKQLGFMVKRASGVIKKENPDYMIVYADTASALGGALASVRNGKPLLHLEAGLRNNDPFSLEDTITTIIDRLAEYHFAPTEKAKMNLIEEGVEKDGIYVVGNPIVDAVYQNVELAMKSDILKKLNLDEQAYFLFTAHRRENVDDFEHLNKLTKILEVVAEKYKVPIICTLHPRTKKMLNSFGLKIPSKVTVLEPISFLDFLKLEKNSSMILTDSCTLQEEACILKIPCITLDDKTARMETLQVGSNVLAGLDIDKILDGIDLMYKKEKNWENPFGDGKSAERTLDIIQNLYNIH